MSAPHLQGSQLAQKVLGLRCQARLGGGLPALPTAAGSSENNCGLPAKALPCQDRKCWGLGRAGALTAPWGALDAATQEPLQELL